MANFFPPSVNGIDREVSLNGSVRASLLFDYSDLDENPLAKVRLYDSNGLDQSGFFTVDGVQQNAGQWFEVAADELDSVRYHAGLIVANEIVNILAYDGGFWSEPTSARVFTVDPNLRPPEVETFDSTVLGNENILARTMFVASDFDGDPITRYRVKDQKSNVNSGSFWLNNVKQRQGRWFELSGEELNKLRYYGGRNPQTEKFFVQAYDGERWSQVESNDVTTTRNRYRPIVTAVDRELKTQTVVNAGNLFSWRDRDGNTAKKYSFFDTGVLIDGGFFSVNCIRQNSREWFTVNARDIENGRVQYHSALVPDNERLRVKVSDGKFFSAVKTFRVDSVATPDIDTPENVQVIGDSTVVDINDWIAQTDAGPAVTRWQFFDATTEKDSFDNELTGSITFEGEALEAQRIRDFTSAELADVSFISGVIDRGIEHDEIYIRGNNGSEWSTWQRVNATTVFNAKEALQDPPLKWGPGVFGTGVTLTYSFPDSLPIYYTDLDEDNGTFQPFTPKMRQATREILKEVYSDRYGLNFVEVSDNVGGVFRFGMIDNVDAIAYAYLPPVFGTNPNNNFGVPGDIWAELDFLYESVDENGDAITMGWFDDWALEKGSDLYLSLIHEVGHAIGLDHPFGETEPGNPVLRPQVNTHEYTTMSYTRSVNIPDPAFPLTDGPATTMLYDEYAIADLYGRNTEVNKEDNVYRWSPNEHDLYAETIFDPSGVDTLNFSNYTPSATIDLREGHLSSVAGELRNFNIAYGTVIENLVSGSGHDNITGNEADNRIIGGRGNDTIATKGGRDTAIGNEGHDTYVYSLGDGKLTIDEDRGGGKDVVEIHAFHDNFDSFKQDLSFAKIDDSKLRISLTMNGEKSEGTITMNNQHWGGSRVETLRLFDNNGEQIGQDMSLRSIFLQATNRLQRFERTEFQDQFGFLAIPS
ncbi:MAG: M10 family metallopeptidase [Planctomycetota bacterium]|nr:M10 family metallopeptidase [Planctomycetota bacterium]